MAFARVGALGTGFGRLGVKKRAGAGAPAAVGGAALLTGETAGFATDFTYATDASRVAVKVASVNTSYALDAFYTNAGTSPKMVYDVSGNLVWSPHNLFLNSDAPVTQTVTTVVGFQYTVTVVGSGSLTVSSGGSGVATAGSPLTYTGTGTTSSIFTKTGTLTQIQMNRGPVATAYLATTGAQRFGLAVDYDPVTHASKGLLVEPAATNLVVRSNDLSVWTTGGMTVAQNAIGPMGANTAWTLTCNAGATGKWTYIDRIGGTAPFRHSIYAKAGTLSWISMGDASASALHAAYFNVSAGTVGTVAGRFSAASMEAVGNGWYRCSATVATGSAYFDVQPHSADNQAYTWTAAGGETVFVSAGQAEAGSVATSYIPTYSATVTRGEDSYRITPASINYSATAGSWWADATPISLVGFRIIGFDGGTASPALTWTAGKISLYDGTFIDKVPTTYFAAHKTAAAFAAGDRAFTVDGAAVGTDAGSTTNLLSPGANIGLGLTPSVGGSCGHFYIRKVRYVPRRKSNAELVTETT